MAWPSDEVRIVPVGAQGRLRAPIAIVCLAIGLAIVKPWGWSTSSEGIPSPSLDSVQRTEAAIPAADDICDSGAGWRIFTVEHNVNGPLHSWMAVEPIWDANGPEDPRIPIIPLATERLDGLGFCSAFLQESPVSNVLGWRILTDSASGSLKLRPFTGATAPDPAIGAVYGPSNGAEPAAIGETPASNSWPNGRYVFAVSEGSAIRWFGLRVETTPSGPRYRP